MLAHRHPLVRIAPLIAAMALGAGGMALYWIVEGGRPFGQVVSAGQVSGQTFSEPTAKPAARPSVKKSSPPPAWRKVRKTRLVSQPPEFARAAKAEAKAKAKRRSSAAAHKAHRTHTNAATVVSAPLSSGATSGTPVAAVPSPVPVAPAPVAPKPVRRVTAPPKPHPEVTGGGAGEG